MSAIVVLSDDEPSETSAASSLQQPALQKLTDEQLALLLQRQEEEAFQLRLPRDAELARVLQLDEEKRSTTQESRPRSRSPHRCKELRSMAAEQPPICQDAVAMLRRCAAGASDANRSEFYFSGPTPYYFQQRLPRHRAEPSGGPGSCQDNWSCGYRNIQMLVGHLLISGYSGLFGGKVPSVSRLQEELERLWADGFDPPGRQQLGGCVRGSQKWIGTSEACVLLRGQAVRCNIVSFRGGVGAESGESAAAAMVDRAIRHFRPTEVNRDPRPPLYLQHDGHSRTVVGVQRRREANGSVKDFLLVLDPGMGEQGFSDFSAAASRGRGWEKFVKRSLAPLIKKAEYELLVLEPGSHELRLEQ
eukprot:TRINITY_DN18634_c0_g1_i2.p1 TRINITY_DN18634_c0_g1~~TRINITY_DN18634_c0_g1_i2.p1  ORF type:complete len:360 (-),score=70.43 TRINITY_DN18634_c0_g1_i2:67-1146(-)